jgi:hypothetical protein
VCDRDCDGGLAHDAGTDDGHEALGHEVRADCVHDLPAPDHSRQLRRQQHPLAGRVGKFRGRRSRAGRSCTSDGCDEAVALTRHILNVAHTLFAVGECFAQRAHVDTEIAGADHQITPDVRDQLLVTDDRAGALDQHDQDIERAVSEIERRAVAFEQALRRREPERSERRGPAV